MHADIISVDADSKLTVKRLRIPAILSECGTHTGCRLVSDTREGLRTAKRSAATFLLLSFATREALSD